jgi:hypothetical protein
MQRYVIFARALSQEQHDRVDSSVLVRSKHLISWVAYLRVPYSPFRHKSHPFGILRWLPHWLRSYANGHTLTMHGLLLCISPYPNLRRTIFISAVSNLPRRWTLANAVNHEVHPRNLFPNRLYEFLSSRCIVANP